MVFEMSPSIYIINQTPHSQNNRNSWFSEVFPLQIFGQSDGVVIAYFYVMYLNDKHHFRSVMTDNVKFSTFISRVDNLPNQIAYSNCDTYKILCYWKIVIVSFIYLIILCIIFSLEDCWGCEFKVEYRSKGATWKASTVIPCIWVLPVSNYYPL